VVARAGAVRFLWAVPHDAMLLLLLLLLIMTPLNESDVMKKRLGNSCGLGSACEVRGVRYIMLRLRTQVS
jgi:hypothetical protein